MITDTEGIILKQVKTVNGRTMLVMFSRKFGKISVGTLKPSDCKYLIKNTAVVRVLPSPKTWICQRREINCAR